MAGSALDGLVREPVRLVLRGRAPQSTGRTAAKELTGNESAPRAPGLLQTLPQLDSLL